MFHCLRLKNGIKQDRYITVHCQIGSPKGNMIHWYITAVLLVLCLHIWYESIQTKHRAT